MHRVTTWHLVGIIAVGALLSGGCERWPWETTPPPAQPPAQNPQAQTPGGGIVVPDSERVAAVNQAAISTTDVELATNELKRLVQVYQQEWKPLSADSLPNDLDLHDVMDNLIDSELKAQDAIGRGLDRRTEVQRRFAYLVRGFYAQEWDRFQRERLEPTDEDAHQFYEQNKAGFMDPERIRVRQVVTATLQEAEAARTQAVQGASFEQLARDRSIGPGTEQGGDIGWHLRAIDWERSRLLGKAPTETTFFPQLEQVAFTLEVGQVSQPVKGPDGHFYLVKLEERTAAKQQSELDVHQMVQELLTLQKVQEQMEQLRTKAKVERFPERLQDVPQ